MKTFQGFETIEIEADSDGIIIRQDDSSCDHPSAVYIPPHMVKSFIKALRDEWASVPSEPPYEGP